jgi:copper chaperone CopZ
MICRILSVASIAMVSLCVGCGRVESPTAKSASTVTPVSFNAAGAPIVKFSVPDMMCPEGCGAKVKEILSEQPGAKDVLVDFPAKTAKVAVDKDKFDAKQAVAALKDHQFKNSALKDANSVEAPISTPAADAKTVQ